MPCSRTGAFHFNGYSLETSQKELEDFTLNMAAGKASFAATAKWFKRYVQKIDF